MIPAIPQAQATVATKPVPGHRPGGVPGGKASLLRRIRTAVAIKPRPSRRRADHPAPPRRGCDSPPRRGGIDHLPVAGIPDSRPDLELGRPPAAAAAARPAGAAPRDAAPPGRSSPRARRPGSPGAAPAGSRPSRRPENLARLGLQGRLSLQRRPRSGPGPPAGRARPAAPAPTTSIPCATCLSRPSRPVSVPPGCRRAEPRGEEEASTHRPGVQVGRAPHQSAMKAAMARVVCRRSSRLVRSSKPCAPSPVGP